MVTLFLVAAVTCPAFALDDAPDKPRKAKEPWEWTDEERLAVRYDPEHMRQRRERGLEEAGEEFLANHPHIPAYKEGLVEIRGNHNPELFMPWELFQKLIQSAYAWPEEKYQVAMRYGYEQDTTGFELGEDFWEVLELAAQDYIELVRAETRFGKELNEASPTQRAKMVEEYEAAHNEQESCGVRSEALRRAEEAIGRELFHRFLYQVVAPGTYVSHPVYRGPDALLYVAGGCR